MRIALLILAACGSSSSVSSGGGVTVELSSVTLADNCGDNARPPPPPIQVAGGRAEEKDAKEDPNARHASCPKGVDCSSGHQRGCDQTSMQLAFAAAEATTVTIKKVELLDDGGTLLEELRVYVPATRWADSQYVAWDGKLAAGQRAQTSYSLASPSWGKLGGRMEAQSKKYQLRVTVEVGGASRTVQKQQIAPAQMEPEVMTAL